jgi:hypothetical protein
MDPAEYKKEWEAGLHQTEYNACRFAEDKFEYGKQWLRKHVPWADFENPKNLVDRICHYKLYDLDPRKPIWADKMCSHWNLFEAGMKELAIEPIYYSRCYLTDHDWENIPNGKYILKMNHGSGWNMKFEKKPGFDPTYLQQKVWEWYHLNFAYVAGWEWQYDKIIPGFVIQPDLGELMNWEFWCEDGKILGVCLTKKLAKNFTQNIVWCDEFGDAAKFDIGPAIRYYMTPSEKAVLEKMRSYVLKLASDFKFVRVDLYHINNEIKFSELTFTPSAGELGLRSFT